MNIDNNKNTIDAFDRDESIRDKEKVPYSYPNTIDAFDRDESIRDKEKVPYSYPNTIDAFDRDNNVFSKIPNAVNKVTIKKIRGKLSDIAQD